MDLLPDYSEWSDDDLMDRVRDHDDDRAFNELYDRWNNRLIWSLFRRCHDRDLAEEAASDAWLNVWRNRKSWRR